MANKVKKDPETKTNEKELKKLKILKPRLADLSRLGESGAAMRSV